MKGGNSHDHTVGGPCLSIDARGRAFSVFCRCGWMSERYASPVVAEAAGEQHVQLGNGRSNRRK
jgi:hypothetical protein